MAGRDYYSLKLKKFQPATAKSGMDGCWWLALFFAIVLFVPLAESGIIPSDLCAIPADFLSLHGILNEYYGWRVTDCVVSHFVGVSLLFILGCSLLSFILLRIFGYVGLWGLVNGVGVVDADGGRVSVKTALKFIFLRPTMIGFGVMGLIYVMSGGIIDLYIVMKVIIFSSFFGGIIVLHDFFSPVEHTFIERISGARFALRQKGQDAWRKKETKMRHGWRKIWHGICFYTQGVFYAAWFLFLSVLTFNLMREPLTFNASERQALYERPAPDWDGNLAIAMAGLSAPENVEDSYEYGREKSAFYINSVNKMKEALRIKFYTDVSDDLISRHSLEREKDEIFFLGDMRKEGVECLYSMDQRSDSDWCPNGGSGDVQSIIESNRRAWARFQEIPSYKKYNPVPVNHNMDLLIDLASVEAGNILSMQGRGEQKKAVADWVRFMSAYNKIIKGADNSRDKGLGFVLWWTNISALETMLFDSPEIAIDLDADLLNVLPFETLGDVNMGSIIADDWAASSLVSYAFFGVSPAEARRVQYCMVLNAELVKKTAAEFFAEKEHNICSNTYLDKGENIILWALSQSGFVVTSMGHQLFSSLEKREAFVKYAHNIVSMTDLVRAAIFILNNDVPEGRIADTLKTMKTGRPILWDPEKRWLYVENPHETYETPRLKFRLNLERKFQ
ncbi:hypothetical protein [Micavibrio aeruginosavorus]|uniref:hypothetical protein n=1 Tax=Micavibrio aeruginosavorus TaxID=349221 RepID=UPI003F4AD54E